MVGYMGWFHVSVQSGEHHDPAAGHRIGVTNGIHILNRYAEERKPSILAKSTGKARLRVGADNDRWIRSLILAKHQGIASLGSVMAVGTTTCMIAA